MPYHIYGCTCGNLWIYNTTKQQETTLCTQCRTTYKVEKREPLARTETHEQAIQARGKLLADRQGYEYPEV